MRRLKTLSFAAAAILASGALFVSCERQPAAPTVVNVNVGVNQNQGGNPGPSPSPSASPGVIDHVGVFNVGLEGGGARCVSTDAHTLHVGCSIWLTCTPKFADGTDVPAEVHGPRPDSFGITSGNTFARADEKDAFDIFAVGLNPGSATVGCTVKGVVSRPFELTVVR